MAIIYGALYARLLLKERDEILFICVLPEAQMASLHSYQLLYIYRWCLLEY